MEETLVEAPSDNDVETLAAADQECEEEEEEVTDEANEIPELKNGEQMPLEENEGTPRVGMAFKTFEEVYEFYNAYARKIGFGTKIRRSWYSIEDGQCNKVMLTCCKEGKRVYKNSERSTYRMRLSARTDCQARVKVQKKYPDGLLYLVEVNLEHNHPVNPTMSRFFRSHKVSNDGSKKPSSSRAKERKETGSFVDKENEDASRKLSSCFLGKEDFEALNQFLSRMQTASSNFFYMMDLDCDGRLRNVFWADGRCKAEYQYFHDVMTFDTTYMTDNYETPLVLFLGVNHHGHPILLGCGLLSNRTALTYTWLFKVWLSCMSGCPPNAIIIDHSEAIQTAATEVFPGVRLRFSLTPIIKTIQENLGGHVEFKAIKENMKKAVYDSLTVEEFECDWKNMVEKHGIADNEWLKSLYDVRNTWVPVFVENSFWAVGVTNAQAKESKSSFFDGFLHPKTPVKQFIDKYETAMKSNYEKEVQADIESFQKSPQLISKLYMEEQLRKIYTVDMFKKFQEEVKAILYCIPSLVKVEGSLSIFEVKECIRISDSKEVQNRNFEVNYNADELLIQCICCAFQSRGILCRHTLSVLNLLEIYEIPSHYIIDRWRKDYKHQHTLVFSPIDVLANKPMERYDNLFKFCLRFAELGAISEDRYESALKMIRAVTEELVVGDCAIGDIQFKSVSCSGSQGNYGAENYKSSTNNSNDEINALMQVRKRGRPPKKRKESFAEKIIENSKRKVCQRKPEVESQSDVLQIAHNTPHFDSHMWSQESISITEQVSPTNLSIGNHFGMQINHQHSIDNQSGIRWTFQQMFQHPHTPDGPPAPWTG